MRRVSDAGVMVGAVTLAGAMLFLATAVTRATLAAPPAPPAAAATGAAVGAPAGSAATSVPGAREEEPASVDVLRLAAERAPFDPDRRAPEARYVLASEAEAAAPVSAALPEQPPSLHFRLLGTVAGSDGGVAVMQVEGGATRVVAVGEEIEGYTLASVDDGRVSMHGGGRGVGLSVTGPLLSEGTARTAAAGSREGGRGGGQWGTGERTFVVDGVQLDFGARRPEEVERIREVLRQGGGAGGGTPGAALRQLLQQRGPGGGR